MEAKAALFGSIHHAITEKCRVWIISGLETLCTSDACTSSWSCPSLRQNGEAAVLISVPLSGTRHNCDDWKRLHSTLLNAGCCPDSVGAPWVSRRRVRKDVLQHLRLCNAWLSEMLLGLIIQQESCKPFNHPTHRRFMCDLVSADLWQQPGLQSASFPNFRSWEKALFLIAGHLVKCFCFACLGPLH